MDKWTRGAVAYAVSSMGNVSREVISESEHGQVDKGSSMGNVSREVISESEHGQVDKGRAAPVPTRWRRLAT